MPRDYDPDSCENDDYNDLGSSANATTVADLEVYGLPVRLIELLDRMDCIYIRDLERLTDAEFLSWPGAGPLRLARVRVALRNCRTGRTVKTVQECVEIQPWGEDRAGAEAGVEAGAETETEAEVPEVPEVLPEEAKAVPDPPEAALDPPEATRSRSGAGWDQEAVGSHETQRELLATIWRSLRAIEAATPPPPRRNHAATPPIGKG